MIPSVWDAIQEALADSEYFLLMASPEAANSPWVRKEVEWWLANRSADNLLILLTDGEIKWDQDTNDFDWLRTKALPPNLSERFSREPLWVDLRWARSDEKLTLRNADFRSAIVKIAATLRKEPPDALDSEDVRVYKRNRLAAYVAVTLSLLLAVGATIEAIEASRSANEAKNQRRVAERNAADAKHEQRLAEENAAAAQKEQRAAEENAATAKKQQGIAEEETATAQRNARESRARELTGYAREILSDNPERSIILAMHAVYATVQHGEPPLPVAEELLHQAILSSQVRLTLCGHTKSVVATAFSPDGTRLATASLDGTAKVWNLANGQNLLTLRGHEGGVRQVVFNPDGSRLATASDDKTAKVWEVTTGRELLTLRGHHGSVSDVAFSPDGGRLVTASLDETIKVWDASTGQELLSLPAHDSVVSVAWSPDGGRLATGGFHGTARVWDVSTGQESLTVRGIAENVAFSSDGRLLVSNSSDHVSIRDVASGNEVRAVSGRYCAFSSDRTRLATTSIDDSHGIRWPETLSTTVKVWDADDSHLLFTVNGVTGCSALSSDGRLLASGGSDGIARVWDAANHQEVLTIHGYIGALSSVAFSPDGAHLATVELEGTADFWDATTGRHLGTLGGTSRLSFNPYGRQLATDERGGSIHLRDPANLHSLFTLHDAVGPLAFSLDGKRLATAAPFEFSLGGKPRAPGTKRAVVKIWDTATARELFTVQSEDGRAAIGLNDLAFNPDGKRLATGGADRTARVWTRPMGASY